jgi:hypothetical protein
MNAVRVLEPMSPIRKQQWSQLSSFQDEEDILQLLLHNNNRGEGGHLIWIARTNFGIRSTRKSYNLCRVYCIMLSTSIERLEVETYHDQVD